MRSLHFIALVALVACTPQAAPVVSTTPIVVDAPSTMAIAVSEPADRRTTESAFVDPSPPKGWTQCAGFVNTADDDIGPSFLDACLDTERLRVRVFTFDDVLEEDVFVTGIERASSWHDAYLGTRSTMVKKTFWGTTEGGAQSIFFTNTDGKDACLQPVAPPGTTTLGSGHAKKAIIVPGAKGYGEYRVSCGGEDLPDRKIAIYR